MSGTCDYVTPIDRPGGGRRLGQCGAPAGRKFRVTTPEPSVDGGVVVRLLDGSTVSWRCAEHSPLSRRSRSVFLAFGVEGFRANTTPPPDPIGWSCQRAVGWVRP